MVLAALYTLTLLRGAWDQASGVTVARPMVRVQIPANPAHTSGEGVELTGTGRLFVSANP